MSMARPDIVVITASTPATAQSYARLVQTRLDAGLFDAAVQFRCYCDPPNGRVGSGGGTVLALHRLLVDDGEEAPPAALSESAAAYFGRLRVLVLHAGGESRRLPCYVPEGKLFAPLALPSTSAFPPVVLDVLLSLYFRYPWQLGEVIVASGDVIVDFDPAKLGDSFTRGDICGFGTATGLEQGSRHGVFGPAAASLEPGASTIRVSDFFQKEPVDTLRQKALLPTAKGGGEYCAVDTGVFSMNASFVAALLGWASVGGADAPLRALYDARLYFDFYLEVVSACLPGLPTSAYVERMSAGGTKLPATQLASLHEACRHFELRAALLEPALFLHFGSLGEYPSASAAVNANGLVPFYRLHSPRLSPHAVEPAGSTVAMNCVRVTVNGRALGDAPLQLAPGFVLLDMCEGACLAVGAGRNLVVGLRFVDLSNWPLPENICIDARQLAADASLHPIEQTVAQVRGSIANFLTELGVCSCSSWRKPRPVASGGVKPEPVPVMRTHGRGGAAGGVVLVYSCLDSFKKAPSLDDVIFCGEPIVRWLSLRGLSPQHVWSDEELEAAGAGKGIELWKGKLFVLWPEGGSWNSPPSPGLAAFIAGYYDIESVDGAWSLEFVRQPRLSLQQINERSSPELRDSLRIKLREMAKSGCT
ncbi:hypothetical protein AB1Y20_001198 [Prymnesium parvum]|uniref:GDP-fucose pyrophosphorylase domain-containing protein n=1 Tax=Prymnesium parvum TaxID=97485 RepID=A0AB34KA69_PRYPA